jgi:hypothetical protein
MSVLYLPARRCRAVKAATTKSVVDLIRVRETGDAVLASDG